MNQKVGNKQGEASSYLHLSNYYRAKKDFKRAVECLQKSLTVAEQAGLKNVSDALEAFSYLYMEAPDDILREMGISPADRLTKSIGTQKKCLQLLYEFGPPSRQLATLKLVSDTYTKT